MNEQNLDTSKLLLEVITYFINNENPSKEKLDSLISIKNILETNIGPRKGEEILVKNQEYDNLPIRAIIIDSSESTFDIIRIGDGETIRLNKSQYHPSDVIEYSYSPQPIVKLEDLYIVYPNGFWTVGKVLERSPKSISLKVKNDQMDFDIPSGNGIGKWKGYKVYTGMDEAITCSKNIKGIIESNN